MSLSVLFTRTALAAVMMGGMVLVASAPASAAIQVFTSQADFEAALSSSFLNAFTTDTGLHFNYTATGNGFTYRATESGTLPEYTFITQSGVLQTDGSRSDLIVTSTSANFNAIGGNFYVGDSVGTFLAGSLFVTASNATETNTQVLTPSSPAIGSFRGFISTTTPLTTLTLSGPVSTGSTNFIYNSLDNLRVGNAGGGVSAVAPEPGSIALALIGGLPIVGLGLCRRKIIH